MTTKLVIVDISSFIFRAFFAIRPLHSPDGTPVNAVYGILQMMIRLMEEHRPTHLLLARDTKEGSFRHEIYPQYKANRSEPPEDLRPQFDIIEKLVNAMELPSLQVPGHEADDIIGATAEQFKGHFDEVIIASGDKDLMQFVGGNVTMLDTMKGVVYDREAVYKKMGVYPEQIVDYLAMVGDSSDNIPGVKGIGAKGAAKLLEQYGSLEKCLQHREEIKGKKAKDGLIEYEDEALLSKKLVQIITDLSLGLDYEQLKLDFHPSEKLFELLDELGFKSSINRLKKIVAKAPVKESIDFEEVESKQQLESILSNIDSGLIGVCVYWQNQQSVFCPHFLSLSFKNRAYLFAQKYAQQALECLASKKQVTLCLEGSKELYRYWLQKKIDYKCNLFDVGMAHFEINPSARHTLSAVALEFGLEPVADFVLEKKAEDFLQQNKLIVVSRALRSEELYEELVAKLKELKVLGVLEQIDSPLTPILAKMEQQGVFVDKKFLATLESEFEKQLDEIQKNVDLQGGEGINLKSPKQVSTLLFETLGLPVVKRTKTGYSTDFEVLEQLSKKNLNEVPGLILRYRELDKLLSTYIRALPKMIDSKTNKVHTHFQAFNAATGRLSSDNPNLQNIPIRTENGRRIRRAFVAAPGHMLVGADYSQVELRILAHLANDPTMIKAFHEDKDIHAQTAAEVLQIPLEQVTREQRSSAKAVNFGLMYGQSSFGLAQSLGISRKEAREYITHYFEQFSKVKAYLDSLRERAEKLGYSETLFGRKRFIPDINSSNRAIKSAAQRVAINSPIQGSAADIIKRAMIALDKALDEQALETKLILQVHDELILEAPESEVEAVKELVVEKMQGAIELKVPLKVDIACAKNWYELK